MTLLSHRPRLSGLAIWNMCVGFFGIQIGFGLQNANTSRIFQTLGAEVDSLAILWIAAPLTGLLVQPLVGHFSDKTWTRFGRRRPYFLVGAILTTLALIAMPNSPGLWFAAAMLWIMDASINITMEPFRAFVGDNLPEEQRTAGYAMQSFFIGAGAVFASCLPWILTEGFDCPSLKTVFCRPSGKSCTVQMGGRDFREASQHCLKGGDQPVAQIDLGLNMLGAVPAALRHDHRDLFIGDDRGRIADLGNLFPQQGIGIFL